MRCCLFILLCLSFAFYSNKSHAQNDAATGALKGIVSDSTGALSAATVAVYLASDTALIAYTLSDKSGAFQFQRLPAGVPLKIVASFVGYEPVTKQLLVQTAGILDLGRINLKFSTNALEAVVVKGVLPPVRMKGDTLEFNADAFKLDANAQTEDLLRILPGITVWADGLITVNGKEISRVLVNGKPFFGNDARVATQNLPKNIVDKVQVYQKNEAKKDSITEMNIKLKKGKDNGYFGKLSGGYGTAGNYEMDGSINLFNSRTQVSVGAVRNNVNKIMEDMGFLLANHTYKGPGANVDYQSNFEMAGLTRFNAGGLLVQHDLVALPGNQNTERVTAEYFINNSRSFLLNTTRTIITVNDSSYFLSDEKSESNSTLLNQQANLHYEKTTSRDRFTLRGNFNRQYLEDDNEDLSLLRNEAEQLLSTNTVSNSSISTKSDLTVIASLVHGPANTKPQRALSTWHIDYSLHAEDYDREQDYQSVYQVVKEPALNRSLSRRYDNQSKWQTHRVKASFPGLGSALFSKGFMAGTALSIHNDVEVRKGKLHDLVMDKEPGPDHYQPNSWLTNQRGETTWNIRPAFGLNRSIGLKADHGYKKELSFGIEYGPQLFALNSTSQKLFQQFSKRYQQWIGHADVVFRVVRHGAFMNSLQLKVAARAQYPTVEQLAPLTDSANLNYIQTGNLYLEQQEIRELSFQFHHNSLRPANSFSYDMNLSAGSINNYFSAASHIDTLGRIVNTIINADGYRFAHLTGKIRKRYSVRNNPLQVSMSATVMLNRTPVYINDKPGYFHNLNIAVHPSLNWSYKAQLVVNIANRFNYNRYSQQGVNNIDVVSTINRLEFSMHLNLNKKLTAGSNVFYTTNTFNRSTHTSFTIWNAHIAYRLFQGNNAEIKISALDLLRQNTGLINYGTNNSVTQGKSNALQQYGMLTLCWYPRKFGK